jgi:hypothetical protein
MDVDAFSLAALLLLLASLAAAWAARRRAARRLALERARARGRRRRVPDVSANVRGLPNAARDLWTDERESQSDAGRRR